MIGCCLLLLVLAPVPAPAEAGSSRQGATKSAVTERLPVEWPDFKATLQRYGESFAKLSSEERDALDVFVHQVGPAVALKGVSQALAARGLPAKLSNELLIDDLRVAARSLIWGLAVWRLGLAARHTDQDRHVDHWSSIHREATSQLRAIALAPGAPPVLETLAAIGQALGAHQQSENDDESAEHYETFARYLDERYPALVGSDSSWLTIFRTTGEAAWDERFHAVPVAQSWDTEKRRRMVNRYKSERLAPILTIEAARLGAELEAWAIERVHAEWLRLRNWKRVVRERRGLSRLCGTWQWAVHNHQNHGDHKTTVTFPPPEGQLTQGMGPAEIVVLGDSVYLRWEVGGHVQEDSLLFGKGDAKLEGSFVNNAGGHGSITGKRIASCGQ